MQQQPIIYLNGKAFPAPASGLSISRVQLVDSTRNSNGQVVAQKIGKRQLKFDGLVWNNLDAQTWHAILAEITKFEVIVRFYDVGVNQWVNLRCYFGDAKETPIKFDQYGVPIRYSVCQCNIIDMGYRT